MGQLIVIGLLAIVFAALYVAGTYFSIDAARTCDFHSALGALDTEKVGACLTLYPMSMDNLSLVLNAFGSFISGGVIGVLALSKPNELPAFRLFNANLQDTARQVVAYMPLIFIIVWIGCGASMVYWGFFYHSGVVPHLTIQAKSWIGSAITALLAYFVQPPGKTTP